MDKWCTVCGPGRVITTCSVYVPGYMKIVVGELSFGREFTAPETVLNSPEVVVPVRTITDPAGGRVREAAETYGKRYAVARMRSRARVSLSIIVVFSYQSKFYVLLSEHV
jgi:hypothetical protein